MFKKCKTIRCIALCTGLAAALGAFIGASVVTAAWPGILGTGANFEIIEVLLTQGMIAGAATIIGVFVGEHVSP